MLGRTRRLAYAALLGLAASYVIFTYLQYAAANSTLWVTGARISMLEEGLATPVVVVGAGWEGGKIRVTLWRTYAYPNLRELEVRVTVVTLSGEHTFFSRLRPATGQLLTQELYPAGLEPGKDPIIQIRLTILADGEVVSEKVVLPGG